MYYDSRMSAFMGAATMQQQCSKRTTVSFKFKLFVYDLST